MGGFVELRADFTFLSAIVRFLSLSIEIVNERGLTCFVCKALTDSGVRIV